MVLHKFKPKRRKNTLFLKVLIFVGIVQVALLVMLGGVMITRAVLPVETSFESAPKPQEIKEPEKTKNVIVKRNMKRSTGAVRRINVVAPKMNTITPMNISLPSGAGGDGGGGFFVSNMDLGSSKIKIDLPTFSLFDMKASSDKVLIVFDAARNTMSDDMGGLDAYNVIKNEITSLVRNLPSTVLFNAIVFDGSRSAFRRNLVPATAANKKAFINWIKPINSDVSKIGVGSFTSSFLELRNPTPPRLDGNALGGLKYNGDWYQALAVYPMYDAYQTAIEQGAGIIYFLTASWHLPKYYLKRPSLSEANAYKNAVAKKKEEFIKKGGVFVSPEEHARLMAAANAAGQRYVDAENAKRRASGKPLWVDHGFLFQLAINKNLPEGQALNKVQLEADMRADWKFKGYTNQTLFASYEKILKKLYDSRNLKRPTLNMILLLPKKGETSLKKDQIAAARQWANINGGGRVRILRGAKPVSDY